MKAFRFMLWHSWIPQLAAAMMTISHTVVHAQPPTLELHTAIFDPMRQRMIVFGGSPGPPTFAFSNDSWQLTLDAVPRWDSLAAIGPLPSARIGQCAVYDPVRDRMLMFGGLDDSITHLADVWSLSLSDPRRWTNLLPSGPAPPARRYSSAIYDPLRDRVLIYGGRNAGPGPFTDVWSLWLAPTLRWERVASNGVPPPGRYSHSAIYDPVGDRMLVFSGFSGYPSNDVWSLSLDDSTWTLLQPLGTPPASRAGHTAVYDPLGQRMVVFGGDTSTQPLNDVWELSLIGTPRWSPINVIGDAPDPRGYHSAVYDSLYSRIVFYGGYPNVPDPTWAFPLTPPAQWSPFRPVIQVSADELHLPSVTVGDTVYARFSITNVGMEPLQVTSLQLPPLQISVTSADPFELAWRDSMAEGLSLVASEPGHVQDSVVIVSNDPAAPRMPLILDIDVLALDFDINVLGSPPQAPLGVALDVVVTPDPGVRIERGALYYRVAGTSVFDSLSLTPLSTDFIAAIPASAVTERGVEYYVNVANSGFSARQPVGAPGAFFTQAVAPPSSMTAIPRPTSGSEFLTGRDIEVEMTMPPGTNFLSGTIHYRQGGETSFASDTLSVSDITGRPVATIPGDVAGPHGVEYWVEVRTLRSTLRFPAGTASAGIRIKVQNLAEPSDHAARRYRLLSVPLDFGVDFSGSLEALLTDQFGTYDPVRWRAYRYDPLAQSNVEFSAAAAAQFRPDSGRAFWLISRDAHRVDTKPIDGFSTSTEADYPIALAPGWNLFGNPFDFPVAWSSVRTPASVEAPVAFDPSRGTVGDYADSPPAVLEPFEGYFIWSGGAADTLWVPPNAATPTVRSGGRSTGDPAFAGPPPARAPSETPGDVWRFRLRAATEHAVDGANELGLNSAAEGGFDPLDLPKPPVPPGSWVRVAFAHPEWHRGSDLYRRDLRRPGSEGETWEIEVESSSPGEPVTLDLSDVVAPAQGVAVRLIDREQGTSSGPASAGAAPTERLRYQLVSFGPRPYRLAIVAGTADYVSRAMQQSLSVPARVVLDQNAPNPFQFGTRVRFGLPRPEPVSLEIYSVLGQRVAALLDRSQLAPGYHSVVWNGTLPGGARAPSGVYLVRLTAGNDARTMRMILVR